MIDFIDEIVWEKYSNCLLEVWGFVLRFNEVILELRIYVLVDCVEKIGIVKYRKFIKDEYVIFWFLNIYFFFILIECVYWFKIILIFFSKRILV